MDLDSFLDKNRINRKVWGDSNLDWGVLCEIADDHRGQVENLRDTADLFARTIQRFPGVHSVRWRIKDTEHLLEKIVRKCADGSEKYNGINVSNYFEKITDLVGVRALHLFKSECFEIDDCLKRTWSFVESPIAYVRDGDPNALTEQFETKGFDVKPHPAGYRSIHYVCSTQPLQRKVMVEIQVRTIFEEGWSEIDHRVRYPNFSDSELVSYFLTIFNRLAGSADEMGTFVQDLTSELFGLSKRILEESKEKEDVLAVMKKTLDELENAKIQDGQTQVRISSLQEEVNKLRNIVSYEKKFGDSNISSIAAREGLILGGLRGLDPNLARLALEGHRPPMQGLSLSVGDWLSTGGIKKALND